jgi:outer membrane protein
VATASARLAAKTAVFTALQEADTAYYGVLAAQDGVSAAQGDWDAAQESLLLAQTKLETGSLTPSALLKAQADVASASAGLDQAQRTLKTAQAKLASLLGTRDPIELKPIDLSLYQGLIEKLSSLKDPSIETLIFLLDQAGEQNNGDLASQVLTVQQAELDMQSAKSAYWPSISASWSDSLNFASSTTTTSGSLQLTATLPLDLWNVSAETGKKKSAQASAALDLAEQRRTLLLNIRSAVYTWLSSARSILSSKTALEYAQSNYEAVLESYKLSLASATDLSTAAQLVSTNRCAYNRAHYDFLQSITDLKTLTALDTEGKLLELVP